MQVEALVSGQGTHPPGLHKHKPFGYLQNASSPSPNPYFCRFFLGSGGTLTESQASHR